jgi:competence protein ComEA
MRGALGARGTISKVKEEKMRRILRQTISILVMLTLLVGLTVGLTSAQEQKKVNINKATVEELSTLNRIGPSYAQRIVDYRNQHGPFQKPEDIMKVKGIGMKVFEANKAIISCE